MGIVVRFLCLSGFSVLVGRSGKFVIRIGFGIIIRYNC